MLMPLLVSSLLTVDAGVSASLLITIETPRSTKGQVLCALFDAPKGFPQASGAQPRKVLAQARAGKTVCEFADVPPGRWAVTVLHDENANGNMDQGVFGIPLEGYGVSNNHFSAVGPPTFDEARFDLAAAQRRELTVTLRY